MGGAIAANQSEGAYLTDGRGLSVTDVVPYGKNRQVIERGLRHYAKELTETNYYPTHHAIDFYHTYEEDLKLLAELCINCFRTSISWTRIYPLGDEEQPNQEGLNFYKNLFMKCKEYGIEPLVTIFHFDVPIHLVETIGSWRNREMIHYYVKYAKPY